MGKYVVEIIQTHTATIEADNEEDAIHKAYHVDIFARKCQCYSTQLGKIVEIPEKG